MSLADREIIADSATVIELQKGANLARPGDSLTYCWLPLSGMIAAIAQDGDGLEAEVAVIGNEGIADIAPLLGSGSASHRLLVQISGAALQLELRHVQALMASSPLFSTTMLAYVHAFTIQTSWSALSFASYPISRRLARWLLMAGDRVGDQSLNITHDALSIRLGVRRAGITLALQALAADSLISTKRGSIAILDRPALARLAGSAYGVPESEYSRLLQTA